MCLTRAKIVSTLVQVFYLFVIAKGVPVYKEDQRDSLITKFQVDPWNPQQYHFEYETSYGTSRFETGYLKKNTRGDTILVTEGFYSYVGPDNKVYRVDYRADENGYRPSFPMIVDSKIDDKSEDDLLNMIFTGDTSTEAPTEMPPKINLAKSVSMPAFSLDNRQLPPGVIASLLG